MKTTEKGAATTFKDNVFQEDLKWKPHEGQAQVLSAFLEGKERIVIAAGVRWGKSAICAYIALRTLLDGLRQKKSTKIWIVAPSYELSQKVFSYIVKWFLAIHPESSSCINYRPIPQIKITEDIWIQGKSATEPNSLLGEELDLIIFDEAAPTNPDIWETYLSARLISRNGKIIFISTPFGQNWFWKKYQMAEEENAAFNFTTLDNPTLENPERVRALEKQLPSQVYRQNYLAS
ncbi:MAG: DEAD/DEAH box helicase family protein, partial [Candidatus Curtissbacteria bacterium]|nr:DEAD/DEAH box helicase family protein [Candidatus Curtissbacteria bacterium]